jgi:hypothetical protein
LRWNQKCFGSPHLERKLAVDERIWSGSRVKTAKGPAVRGAGGRPLLQKQEGIETPELPAASMRIQPFGFVPPNLLISEGITDVLSAMS